MDYQPDPDAPQDGVVEQRGGALLWRQRHEDLLEGAVNAWGHDPPLMRRHLEAAMRGEPGPATVYGARDRARAEALFYEITTNPRRAPRLYRGAMGKPTGLASWTTSRRVAERFAAKSYGEVTELAPGARGLRVSDYARRPAHPEEREWIMWHGPVSEPTLAIPARKNPGASAPGSAGGFDRRPGGEFVGYKVMGYDPDTRELVSGADPRLRARPTIGSVHRMPGAGIFLGPSKKWVVDYYAVFAYNAVLTYAFDVSDVLTGSVAAMDSEISVSRATLLGCELFDEEMEPLRTRSNPTPDGGEFWGSEGAGVLPLALSTGRVLLGLRSEEVNEPGTWGVWGGAFRGARGEDDELVAAVAALREFREETRWDGDAVGDLEPLYLFERPGFRFHNFLLVLPREFSPRLNWEHDEAGWFDLDRLPEELHFGLQELLEDPASVATIRSHIARRKPRARR